MDTESLEEWWPGAGAGGHGELLCRDDSFRFLKERATELLHDNVHVVIIDRASQVSRTSACNAGDPSLISGSGRSPKEGTATHSSILAWRIPGTQEPGGLQSVGLQRVGHD